MLNKQSGNYNEETSIHINALNPRCFEEDIVEELNLILRDHRLKREKMKTDHDVQSENFFILSCIVFIDSTTKQSKRFAFVDLNCKEAA